MGRHHQEGAQPFRMLFVCTGNICRSPFAEILTRHLLVGRLGGRKAAEFEVSSAGVQAVVGSQMHPQTRAELAPWKLDGHMADPFRARQLRSAIATESDLVLGLNPQHRAVVVERAPATLATAFGLREFARLVGLVDEGLLPDEPVARVRALVVEARRCRGMAAPVGSAEDQIVDPIGQGDETHHEAAMLIYASVTRIVDVIAPPARPAVPDAPSPFPLAQ